MNRGLVPSVHCMLTKSSFCKLLCPSPNTYMKLPTMPVAVSESSFGIFAANRHFNGTVVVVLVVRVVVVNVAVVFVRDVDVFVRVVRVRVVSVRVVVVLVVAVLVLEVHPSCLT